MKLPLAVPYSMQELRGWYERHLPTTLEMSKEQERHYREHLGRAIVLAKQVIYKGIHITVV